MNQYAFNPFVEGSYGLTYVNLQGGIYAVAVPEFMEQTFSLRIAIDKLYKLIPMLFVPKRAP